MMKLLCLVSVIIFTNVAYGNDALRTQQTKELIYQDGAAWVDSLARKDVIKFSTDPLYFKYFAILFSQTCNPNILQNLLDKGLNPNTKGKYFNLAEVLVMNCKDNKGLKKLIGAGLDINITSINYKMTLLNMAVSSANQNAIKLICQNNIKLDPTSISFKTTIKIAKLSDQFTFLTETCGDLF